MKTKVLFANKAGENIISLTLVAGHDKNYPDHVSVTYSFPGAPAETVHPESCKEAFEECAPAISKWCHDRGLTLWAY